MKNQFVTYEIALKLKDLGFDEECLGWFWGKTPELAVGKATLNTLINPAILAPLWQQAIDWLREKHKVHIIIEPIHTVSKGVVFVGDLVFECTIEEEIIHTEWFNSYHEALEFLITEQLNFLLFPSI